MILLQVFGQNVTTYPGTGTFGSHTFEVILMLLGAFLLGWFLHHVIFCTRHKARIADLEADLRSAKGKLKSATSELEDCRASVITLKGDNAGLSSRLKSLGSTSIAADPVVVQDTPPEVEEVASSIAASIPDPAPASAFDAEAAKAIFGKRIKEDDLKIVEGIGPKTEGLLNDSSIRTWRQLSETSVPHLQSILDKAGDRYQLLNPGTWPKQSKLAADGEWLKLREYQDWLVGGVEPEGETMTFSGDSGNVQYIMGKRIVQDDLTVVEGIGPKISELLQNNGINTWRGLSTTSTERLQEILNSAGDRYRIHNPSTWARQAEMAADGKWDDLQEYQDFLDGGVIPE